GIYDADNLTLREQINLPENLAGKSLLTSDRDVMYSISDSGVTVLPIGSLRRAHRVRAEQEDIVFRGNFCNRTVATQQLTITDPARNRYYVLRQDKNQVLVFDSTSNQQTAVLRTGNTPTSMAMTFDNFYLLIGHDDSQVAYVYDLNTLKPELPIVMPFGHY